MPSAEMQEIIDFLYKRKATRESGPKRTLPESRLTYAPVGQLRPIPDDVKIEPMSAGDVPVYWLTAPGAVGSSKVLVYLHGGGYSLGSLRSHGPLASYLGRTTARRVLFPEYRLAPEHPFPAAFDDTLAAWRWSVSKGGVDPSSTIFAGDSAGGGLVLALLHALRDSGEPLPSAAVLISPFLDLTISGPSITDRASLDPILTREVLQDLASQYLIGTNPRNSSASPLFASQSGLPPLLIQVGGADILLSDSERLADAAVEAGVNVTVNIAEGLPHIYHGAIDTPETAEAMRQIAGFARRF